MKNIDKVRTADLEDLIKILGCKCCIYGKCEDCVDHTCEEGISAWLDLEEEE